MIENQAPILESRALGAAKRCVWIGVACLYAWLFLIVLVGCMGLDISLWPLGLPLAMETWARRLFFLSWPLGCVGFLFRASEPHFELKAPAPGQHALLRAALSCRRMCLLCFAGVPALACAAPLLNAPLGWLHVPGAAVSVTASILLLLTLGAGFSLLHRMGEMMRRALPQEESQTPR